MVYQKTWPDHGLTYPSTSWIRYSLANRRFCANFTFLNKLLFDAINCTAVLENIDRFSRLS